MLDILLSYVLTLLQLFPVIFSLRENLNFDLTLTIWFIWSPVNGIISPLSMRQSFSCL